MDGVTTEGMKLTVRRRESADGAAEQTERLLGALSREFRTIVRLVSLLDAETVGEVESCDEVIEWLSVIATSPGRSVPEGCERGFILSAALALLDADVGGRERERRLTELPQLRQRSPMPSRDLDLDLEDFLELVEAFQEMDRPTRAAVFLVVHEGLSVEDAVSIQGGSVKGFARRYRRGVRAMPAELLDVLMGREAREAREAT